jgi:hypothetical protein
MMVDDVAAIMLKDAGEQVVVPSYPRTRLWGNTARRLSIDTSGLPRTRSDMDKFERQLPDQFWDQEAPLLRVYHLAGSNGDELSLTPLGSIDAFRTVLGNTYRELLLDGLARRQEHFEIASSISKTVPVIRVIRPVDTFRLVDLADMIMEDLAGA